MRERGHSLESLRQAVRDGRLAFGYAESLLPDAERDVHGRRGRRAHRARGGADRAADGAARDPDRARGNADRAGRRRDGADRRDPRDRLPARRPAPARPRLRPVDAQDRRGGDPDVPPLRPRAADPPGRRRARDGGGDGGAGRRADAADGAADRVPAPALPPLLLRAGRRRPHGDRVRRPRQPRPRDDGLLLRRPRRLHPLHRGGGRRGGARPDRAIRRDGRGHPARAGRRW